MLSEDYRRRSWGRNITNRRSANSEQFCQALVKKDLKMRKMFRLNVSIYTEIWEDLMSVLLGHLIALTGLLLQTLKQNRLSPETIRFITSNPSQVENEAIEGTSSAPIWSESSELSNENAREYASPCGIKVILSNTKKKISNPAKTVEIAGKESWEQGTAQSSCKMFYFPVDKEYL